MQVDELLRKVQFVTDQSGKKTAVLIDYTFWEELLELLEDLEDGAEIDRFHDSGEEAIPWEQVKEELRAKGIDVSN